jgi:hypothetical protein
VAFSPQYGKKRMIGQMICACRADDVAARLPAEVRETTLSDDRQQLKPIAKSGTIEQIEFL